MKLFAIVLLWRTITRLPKKFTGPEPGATTESSARTLHLKEQKIFWSIRPRFRLDLTVSEREGLQHCLGGCNHKEITTKTQQHKLSRQKASSRSACPTNLDSAIGQSLRKLSVDLASLLVIHKASVLFKF